MADVRALRSGLATFASEVGSPLTDWQIRALGLESRVSAIVAPRQSGKSRSLAVLALWRAFRAREQRVLLLSAGEEAARRLLGQVRRVATGSPLLAGSVVDEQAALVTLSNGSEVRSVPASERQIRGWSVDLLLVDEAALVPDDLLLGAAFPTTAARQGARIVLASSALTVAGAFFDHVRLGESGSGYVRAFRWALADCWWISPSAVEAARESMSEARFRAEYEGVFASGADALFSRAALDRVIVDYLPSPLAGLRGPARVLGGVDWGAVRDRSAFVAVGRLAAPGERLFGVACAHRWPAGYPLPSVVEEIAASPAHFFAVAAETNGLGLPLTRDLFGRLLRRDHAAGGGSRQSALLLDVRDAFRTWDYPPPRLQRRWPEGVEMLAANPARRPGARAFATRKLAVHTSADVKATAYGALRLLVDREQLLIPAAAEDLIRELLMLRVDLTPGGGERIEASSGHDDLADAMMLAAAPYRPHGKPWRVFLAELAARPSLPEPALPAALRSAPHVITPGGVAIPRCPIWQSVNDDHLTLPTGLAESDRTHTTPGGPMYA